MRFRKQIRTKTPTEIGYMRQAGLIVADIHAALRAACRPGISTAELDEVSAQVISKSEGKSNFYNYHGFPATTCISVNDEIVHGIPGEKVLQAGDLVTFDCGAYIEREGKQWHGDAAFTMIVGGSGPDEAHLIDTVTKLSLHNAIAALAGGAQRLNAVGDAVEATVEDFSLEHQMPIGIVEDYVGHGIGNAMHEAPDVYNYSVADKLLKIRPGMVFAIEPMLTSGSADNTVDPDGWTVRTMDGSLAAQWEHTVAIMPGGVWVLTAPDGGEEILSPYGMKPVALPGQ